MPTRVGFTLTQNSFNGSQGSSEAVANANLKQLNAQNQHVKDFGAADPLPMVNVTAVALVSGTTYRYSVAQTTWAVNDKVAVQGLTPAGFNGYFTISARTSTTVDLNIGSNPGTAGSFPGSMANVFQPVYSGSSGLDALVADMITTRGAGAFSCLTMNKSPVILTVGMAGGDTKVDPTLGGTQGGNPGWDAFADLAYEIIARYVNNNQLGSPLYVQWWNELKGMFDGGLNRWDYVSYVNFFNAGWNKVRADGRGLIAAAGKNPAAGTDILIGGPYVHINFYSRSDTVPNHAHSNGQIGTVGFADMQGPDVIDYFTAFAAGYDFVCFDGGSKFMDLFEIVGGVPLSTNGLVLCAEGIGTANFPGIHVGAFTQGGTLKQDNMQTSLLTRAQVSQSWQDVINWIVNTVFPGNGALNGGQGVRPTKPIWISEFHVGNATETSTGVSGSKGNRNISDANMGLLVTDGLAKINAAANANTSVTLYWGTEDRPATQSPSGNDPGVSMYHEVDYPSVVYPTNQGTPPGGTVTPVGTALGIGASGVVIVGDGPSGR